MNVNDWDGTTPLPTLYSKTATGAINVWVCWVFGDSVCVRWGQIDGTAQEASFKCKPKNIGRANATTAEQQAIKEAIAKWKKQKKLKYSESLETAGQTARVKPMLALHFADHKAKLTYPVSIQPKLEGVRCLAFRGEDGSVMLQSRRGEEYKLPHIREQIEPWLHNDTILDGELYVHGASQQSINSLARRPRDESRSLYYCLYDVTNRDHTMGPWCERRNWLRGLFHSLNGYYNHLWEVPTLEIHSEAEAYKIQSDFVGEGFEGAIVRAHSGLYKEDYRSPDLLKLKNWMDAEFFIVSAVAGKGKFENAPVFTCLVGEGHFDKDTGAPLTFDVVPKGTASERAKMLENAASYVGHQLTVQFFGYTAAGKPYHARGIAIRHPGD